MQYVASVCAGPAREDLDQAMIRSCAVLDARGELDHRRSAEMDAAEHPVLDILLNSNLDITSHVLQSRVRAQDVLTAHFCRSLDLHPDSVVSRARAAAVFATWMATLLAYQDERGGRSTSSQPCTRSPSPSSGRTNKLNRCAGE